MKPQTWKGIICSHGISFLTITFVLLITATPAKPQQSEFRHTSSPLWTGGTHTLTTIETSPRGSGPANNGGVILSAGSPGVSLLNPTTLLGGVAISNEGTVPASAVVVTSVTLTGGTLIYPPLPLNLGPIPVNGEALVRANFSGNFTAGGQYILGLTGAYTAGAATYSFALTQVLTAPPASPGSASTATSVVASHTVSGAPYPHQPLNFGPEVNLEGWTVPTGPFVAGMPTPTGTSAQRPGDRRGGRAAQTAPGTVVFELNNGLGLISGGTNGTASTVAEPSGADNGGSVVFASANWLGAYSTDAGTTFHQLDPTTIFPNDAVGYCCDQIVQYVPSIDRFVWLLQGNGYRLAVAKPADVMSSGGTAWTYWNLTPELFGQPTGTGFDYPDLSVGNNYLYISWDAGIPCPPGCNGGHQVVRIQLSQLQAGGSISIGYTNPSDSPMAWGGKLSQDTLDEIFWAGHNSNSNMRVFSWAEGSGSYFWRDIGVSTWANNALSSTTPDNQDWLTKGRGFPGNAMIGATRVSNQIWLAWTAGTDNNFQQDHVEMVTLDRSNNFNVIQQVQIWNNSYAFAYPALATNACTGEVGLSLEYGGNGNYENHVVGFWGDFLVYITTDSNLGTGRYGDYVTIRQETGTFGASPLFAAFGYGLDTGPSTDVRYVVFGRPSCDTRSQTPLKERSRN